MKDIERESKNSTKAQMEKTLEQIRQVKKLSPEKLAGIISRMSPEHAESFKAF